MPEVDAYLTLAEGADRLGVSTKTIRRRIADGTLTGYRFGPHLIRLRAAELDATLREVPSAACAAQGARLRSGGVA